MKTIYITWHYTTHGIAYLKHILSAFYSGKCKVSENKPIRSDKPLSQDEMNEVFDNHNSGFLFDKVYYITAPQQTFDRISHRRFKYRSNMFTDEEVKKQGMVSVWQNVVKQKNTTIEADQKFIEKNYPDKAGLFGQLLWRDMQHYTISEQIKWFKNSSNAAPLYGSRLEEIALKIDDLRDVKQISDALIPVIKQLIGKHAAAEFVIDVSLGSNETQVAWHILAENNFLPQKTRLITTYDDKTSNQGKRLKLFSVKEQPLKLITELSSNFNIYKTTRSQSRRLANVKMKTFIKQGFAILLLGERGTGKTMLVREFTQNMKNYAEANCASFDDDNKAEADLFGYVKGAYTGADRDTDGLFHQAKGGILFLDEIHHLSPRVQAKLVTALQTDQQNNFTIRRLKSNTTEKIKCTVILASNNTIGQLRRKLYPDLFDRITQLIIEFPPLRQTPDERLTDWEAVWRQMRFSETMPFPQEAKLMNWLEQLDLYGNFRDLQKIAIYYHTFQEFSKEEKKIIGIKNAFEFAKAEFEKYYSVENEAYSAYFDKRKSLEEIRFTFERHLAQWLIAEFGSAKKAAEYFKNEKGDSITQRTIYKWKNGK